MNQSMHIFYSMKECDFYMNSILIFINYRSSSVRIAQSKPFPFLSTCWVLDQLKIPFQSFSQFLPLWTTCLADHKFFKVLLPLCILSCPHLSNQMPTTFPSWNSFSLAFFILPTLTFETMIKILRTQCYHCRLGQLLPTDPTSLPQLLPLP